VSPYFSLNKRLLTCSATFHSRHHRLYVPYAYGALYNHPVEGFTLDTLGTGIAHLLTRGTVRQSIFFFTFSSIKTVDDHCGYALPWDPLQHITSNNATYHDIHHQSWGIKSNFSQPFFTFWDSFFNTKWRGDTKLRYEKQRHIADAWWEEQKLKSLNLETVSGTNKEEDAINAEVLADQAPILLPSETSRVRRSPRKGTNSVQLKGLKERMVSGSALPGVPRVESSR
jgi:sphinganine C4-monooxygenase